MIYVINIKIFAILSIMLSVILCSNLYAEYCFEIPDEKTHEDSKKSNEIVFNMGVIIYESLQAIEKKDYNSANNKIAIIRDKTNELINIYTNIEKELKHMKLDISKMQEGDRNYIGSLINEKNYRPPVTDKEFANIALLEINEFNERINSNDIKYGEIRAKNLATIRELLYVYYKLTRIGFIFSDVAYKSIGK